MRTQARAIGHFGELLQGRLGREGPVALVTLPCPELAVAAQVHPAAGLALHGSGQRLLTPARARKFLQLLGLSLQGRIVLRADMPAGCGAGASTATLVALAELARWQGSAQTLAEACLAIEGATDPLMFLSPETMLWASRHAEPIALLPPLPEFDVMGGFWGDGQRTDPTDHDFPDISDLIPRWANAAAAADLAGLAALCSTSASRCLAHRPSSHTTRTDPTASLAADLGALGYVIAHTGAARGLIYAPGQIPDQAYAALRAAGLRRIVRFRAGGRR
jgi:uncharacterized protein involved in propanediol utilization